MKKLAVVLFAALVACAPTVASVEVPTAPTLAALVTMGEDGTLPTAAMRRMNTAGTPDSLIVVVRLSTPGAVPSPTGASVLHSFTWTRNGLPASAKPFGPATADTLRIARSPLGQSDTVSVAVVASYKGRVSQPATATRIFANPDTQTPSMPVIVVDTL
jgi:hypothetical protein